MLADYAKHAAVWDWDGYDYSSDYDYWCRYAERFGKKVLIPMCALGQVGAYMAKKGFCVTAFDIIKEMIDEGKKRFGSLNNLSLRVADLCDLHFDEKSFDFCFISTQDLHLLPELEMVKKAFRSIASHLRKGGCLSLELILPLSDSYETPLRTFYPRVPNDTDKKVWKESRERYDASSKRHDIEQIVYMQDAEGIESFPYAVTLRYFEREEIRSALENAGFGITAEYRSRNGDAWTPESREWTVEAVKI